MRWFAIWLAEGPDLFRSVLEHLGSPRVLKSVGHTETARVLKLEDAAQWSL